MIINGHYAGDKVGPRSPFLSFNLLLFYFISVFNHLLSCLVLSCLVFFIHFLSFLLFLCLVLPSLIDCRKRNIKMKQKHNMYATVLQEHGWESNRIIYSNIFHTITDYYITHSTFFSGTHRSNTVYYVCTG